MLSILLQFGLLISLGIMIEFYLKKKSITVQPLYLHTRAKHYFGKSLFKRSTTTLQGILEQF